MWFKVPECGTSSCVTEIGLCNYLRQAWTLPASEDIYRVELIQAAPLLLSVSLLMFSFLPFFYFVHSFSQESQCQTHMQLFTAFGCLPIIFPPLFSPFYPNAQLIVTFPSWFMAITTAARAFDPCLLPETSNFSISLSPVLQLSVANLMLVHVLVSQWTCAVVTGTRIDTPETPLKSSVEQVLGVWLHVWYKLVYNHLTDLSLAVCSCLFHPHNQSWWLCSEFVDAIKQKSNHFFLCMFLKSD